MTPVTTATIKLTKDAYFKILSLKYFRERWWLMAIIILCALSVLFKENKEGVDYFLIFWGVAFPIYILIYFWRFAHSKDNKVMFLVRHYQINEDELIGFLEDNTQSPIRLEHFIKIYRTKEYALIYLSKATFIYLPINAFDSEESYINTLRHIDSKILAAKSL